MNMMIGVLVVKLGKFKDFGAFAETVPEYF
jgi:hypothetical protein